MGIDREHHPNDAIRTVALVDNGRSKVLARSSGTPLSAGPVPGAVQRHAAIGRPGAWRGDRGQSLFVGFAVLHCMRSYVRN